jgi:glutamate synthase (NADPH/NADH) large chain
VGNIFFSTQAGSNVQRKIINEECKKLSFENIFFRQIPVNPSVLGSIAINSLPYIEQLFINAPEKVNQIEFELQLFILRKNIEYRLRENAGFFICSLSSSTIVYKALCLPQILKEFYLDLTDPLFKTSICVFHQRFSTNTQPSWHLAQPFRYLAHNGEINTVSSNRLWAKERSVKLLPVHIQEKLASFDNLVNSFGSDSFSLDNMLEILLILGVDYKQALRTLIPPYHNQNNKLSRMLQNGMKLWKLALNHGMVPPE